MTQNEREQLSAIIEQLEAIRDVAPQKTTYVMGRTEGGIAYRLSDVISQLRDIVGEQPAEAKTE